MKDDPATFDGVRDMDAELLDFTQKGSRDRLQTRGNRHSNAQAGLGRTLTRLYTVSLASIFRCLCRGQSHIYRPVKCLCI